LKQQEIPVVSVFLSVRPLWVNPELNASTAFVAAWLPGTEGAGVADVVFRNNDGEVNYDLTGKLSFSWPKDAMQTPLNRGDADYDPLFPYGFGLTYDDYDYLSDDLSEVDSTPMDSGESAEEPQ
jgi:beta-glucosidase